MDNLPFNHLRSVCCEWARVHHVSTTSQSVQITGEALNISDVVAVALHGTSARLTDDKAVRQRIRASVAFLADELAAGMVIYGVNTGFGGSADTRTQDFHRLQSALVQHLNVGILLPADKGQGAASSNAFVSVPSRPMRTDLLLRSHALPPAVVRAMILVRSNSLARGHSAVRVEVVEALLRLLAANMTPVVPLRGSISASGDLSTLSYVAGALEGNPDVHVRWEGHGGAARYLPADRALAEIGLAPMRLQAKEGLGITNGTAPSCATACLALYTANQMAVLTQLLTAMGTEALAGTAHNYDPFIGKVRAHAGQCEAASNIRNFLAGSRLSPALGPSSVGLAQDRYALRTAPQWIGPQLEDLDLATRQVTTELNATTDNPLIDVASRAVHHGGNFQAMSITSAMEKTMTALQNLGRLLFAQSAELVDSARNRGLPPNLSIDDPSTSFLCKGFDVNMAAYQAELAYLAHPVSGHVQVAEMANQSVNSMALVAARYALEAAEVVGLMAATYIFLLCQAVDLRIMQNRFHAWATTFVDEGVQRLLLSCGGAADGASASETVRVASEAITAKVLERWDALSHLDCGPRAEAAARDATGTLLAALPGSGAVPATRVPDGTALLSFQEKLAAGLAHMYGETRKAMLSEAVSASQFLSPATRIVYEFVRLELRIPLHRGIDAHPPLAAETRGANGGGSNSTREAAADGTRILGTMASEIYMALRDGRLFDRLFMHVLEKKAYED